MVTRIHFIMVSVADAYAFGTALPPMTKAV